MSDLTWTPLVAGTGQIVDGGHEAVGDSGQVYTVLPMPKPDEHGYRWYCLATDGPEKPLKFHSPKAARDMASVWEMAATA